MQTASLKDVTRTGNCNGKDYGNKDCHGHGS